MQLKLPRLILSVRQMCNLRCKNCGNFVPYAPKETRRYPIENIIADFESLFKVVGKIKRLQIQGGEPLLYSDLPKLTSYLRARKEVQKIIVATNGMICPDDELMKNFAANKIHIRVSNYLKNKSTLLADKAKIFGVEIRLYNFVSGEALWYDCGDKNTPREDDDAVVAERFANCAFNICLTLENGKLHRCSRAPNAHKIQGFDAIPKIDFVSVRDNDNLRDHLISYLANPHFETACRHCYGTAGAKKIPAAEQL